MKRFCPVVVFFLFIIGINGCRGPGADNSSENLTTNYYALHDINSPQYRDDCLSCHSDILTEEALDPLVPTAHNAMLPETPGDTVQEQCVFCHVGVDLMEFSAGNIRRQVKVETCQLCHGPSGPSTKQYYQE